MEKSLKTNGALALVGAAGIYATFGPLIRILETMYGDYTQVAARLILAFIFLFLLNKIMGNSNSLSKQHLVRALTLGVMFGLILLLFTVSVTHTKIANAVFLLYAGSLSVSFIVGTAFLKEKVNLQKIVALLLAFGGIAMYTDLITALNVGIIAGLASGAIEGVANAYRKLLKDADRMKVLEWQLLGAALVGLVATFFIEGITIKEISLLAIGATILFALLQIKLGDLLLYGFQHFDVNVGTVILSLELVFATILGFVFFGEILTSSEIIGGVLIFGASVVSIISFGKKA